MGSHSHDQRGGHCRLAADNSSLRQPEERNSRHREAGRNNQQADYRYAVHTDFSRELQVREMIWIKLVCQSTCEIFPGFVRGGIALRKHDWRARAFGVNF